MIHLTLLNHGLLYVARGGGGGSSSGGGGGGLGIAAIGYLPAHFATSRSLKRLPENIAAIIGSVVGAVITVPILIFSPFAGLLVGVGAAVGVYSGLHDWLGRLTQRAKRAKQTVAIAASVDPVWQQADLEQRVYDVFLRYQQDWSKLDTSRLTTYATEHYSRHAYYMMTALYQMGRRNAVDNVHIDQVVISDATDAHENEHDRFTATVTARADDRLIDAASNKELNKDKSTFSEYWTFARRGNEWFLDHIDQATAEPAMGWYRIKQFAEANNMFYSLDWGTLLLPEHGRMFKRGSFKKSDINNHVIGQWNDLLVQLYTYNPNKQQPKKEYLIGQLNLPKTYGGIIIERKAGWQPFKLTPRGYKRVRFEWPDFNKRYDVYATDVEKITAFELLNPKTMADLYDLGLPVNIEVVDNIVYFYCRMNLAEARYVQMMQVLQMAYKELRR